MNGIIYIVLLFYEIIHLTYIMNCHL